MLFPFPIAAASASKLSLIRIELVHGWSFGLGASDGHPVPKQNMATRSQQGPIGRSPVAEAGSTDTIDKERASKNTIPFFFMANRIKHATLLGNKFYLVIM